MKDATSNHQAGTLQKRTRQIQLLRLFYLIFQQRKISLFKRMDHYQIQTKRWQKTSALSVRGGGGGGEKKRGVFPGGEKKNKKRYNP